MKKLLINRSILVLALVMGPSVFALEDQWFIGLGVGSSWLVPDPVDPALDDLENQGTGSTIFIGRDLGDLSSLQLQYHSLGEVALRDGRKVGYNAFDANIIYRFYDSRDGKIFRDGFGLSFYGRFGLGGVFRDPPSGVKLRDESTVYFSIGAGFEVYFNPVFAARLGGAYLEKDASYVALSLVTRFGGSGPGSTRPLVPVSRNKQEPTKPSISEPSTEVDISVAGTTPSVAPLPSVLPVPKGADVLKDSATEALVDQQEQNDVEPVAQSESTGVEADTARLDQSEVQKAEVDLPSVPLLEDSVSTSSLPSEPAAETVETVTESQESIEPPNSVAVVEEPEVSAPISEEPPQPQTLVRPSEFDRDGDGVSERQDQCPDSAPGFPVLEDGCPLFDGELSGVDFEPGTAALSRSSKQQLDFLAGLLKEYPASRIVIFAHTDNSGSLQEQSAVTRARLRAVGGYLLGKGIQSKRMVLRSMGGSQPIFDNDSADGKAGNNRIELREYR